MEENFDNENRSYENVLSDISELARIFLDERRTVAAMRTDIKKRSARARLYIVNGLSEFLQPETVAQLELLKKNNIKITLDTIDALIAVELGEDFAAYEAAKFNADTSEKAFPMFQAELSGFQSKFKREAAEMANLDYAQRMTAQR